MSESPLPSFARAAPVAPVPRRWPARLALLALLLALPLQMLLAERARLAADPVWRPLLEQACRRLGCALPPWREPDRFAVIAREVRPHPESANALQLRLAFRNDARWPQGWPLLELGFSDVDGRLQAQRVFLPSEYLGGDPAFTTIAPGQTVELTLDLLDPGPQALAFQLDFR